MPNQGQVETGRKRQSRGAGRRVLCTCPLKLRSSLLMGNIRGMFFFTWISLGSGLRRICILVIVSIVFFGFSNMLWGFCEPWGCVSDICLVIQKQPASRASQGRGLVEALRDHVCEPLGHSSADLRVCQRRAFNWGHCLVLKKMNYFYLWFSGHLPEPSLAVEQENKSELAVWAL